jgi:ADP-ribose pyrophosphatase
MGAFLSPSAFHLRFTSVAAVSPFAKSLKKRRASAKMFQETRYPVNGYKSSMMQEEDLMSVKVNKITNLYKGKIFDVALEKVTLPNGMIKDREVVRHPGAAAMVPLLDDGKVVLIKQYRHAVNRYLWEIPAGTLEPSEEPVECARRELVEETGYEASTFDELTQILPAPGYTDECIHIFLATGLTPAEQKLEDDEVLECRPTHFETAIEMITKGEIQDAKTIAGLLLTSLKRSLIV